MGRSGDGPYGQPRGGYCRMYLDCRHRWHPPLAEGMLGARRGPDGSAGLLAMLGLLPTVRLVHYIYFDRSGLPDLERFIHFEIPTIGHVYDAQGTVLIELAREYRRVISFDEVPAREIEQRIDQYLQKHAAPKVDDALSAVARSPSAPGSPRRRSTPRDRRASRRGAGTPRAGRLRGIRGRSRQ